MVCPACVAGAAVAVSTGAAVTAAAAQNNVSYKYAAIPLIMGIGYASYKLYQSGLFNSAYNKVAEEYNYLFNIIPEATEEEQVSFSSTDESMTSFNGASSSILSDCGCES
jgi:hypothetical protein